MDAPEYKALKPCTECTASDETLERKGTRALKQTMLIKKSWAQSKTKTKVAIPAGN